MDQDSHHSSFLARALTALSLTTFRFPILTCVLCGLLAVVSLVYSQHHLKLQMDWTYLFYPNEPIVVAGQEARKVFPLPGDIVVLVDQGSFQERKVFLDRLATRLEAEPQTFYHVFYRFDLKPLADKALYYLDTPSLKQLADGLDSIYHGSAQGAQQGTGRKIFLKLLNDLDQALKTRGRATYVPIWQVLALAEDQGLETTNYLAGLMHGQDYIYPTINDGRINLLLTKAGTRGQTFADAGPLVARLHVILAELTPTAPNLRVRLTGLPVMLYDERNTATADGTFSTIISVVLCVTVFILGFGEVLRPVLASTALMIGIAWTSGFTALTVGHLNFISVSLATMLTGIGIDFGIHFIFRYDEEISKGAQPEEAIKRTQAHNGVDTLVGALATSTAFMALTMANFRGITDFAIVAASGTMITFFSTIIVLPALLRLFPGRAKGTAGHSREVVWLENKLLKNAGIITVSVLISLIAMSFWATKASFSYNLLEVQDQELSTVRTELEMIRETKSTVLSAEALDKGEAEARRKLKAYEALPTVARVGSILPLLPDTNPEKQALIERIVSRVHQLSLPPRVNLSSAEDLLAIERRVKEMEAQLPKSDNDPEVATKIQDLKASVKAMDPGPIQDGLSIFQREVRTDLSTTLAFLKQQHAQAPKLKDLPSELRLRYVSPDGTFRQTIQPVHNIWERHNLEPFLKDVKSVDPKIMGHPVVQEQILAAFARTLDRTPLYTLAGVLIIFAIYLRDPKAILLSLLPSAAGLLTIFATMGFLHRQFNVVNFVGLPISVGLGAVYGVYALHRMQQDNNERLLSCSTGPALFLSGLTDFIGFAALIPASHRGISSLGFVISIGVAVNFLGSLLILPPLRRVLHRRSLKRSVCAPDDWSPPSADKA